MMRLGSGVWHIRKYFPLLQNICCCAWHWSSDAPWPMCLTLAAACFVLDAWLGDDAELLIYSSMIVSCAWWPSAAAAWPQPLVTRCGGGEVRWSRARTSAASDQRWRHPPSAQPHQPELVTARNCALYGTPWIGFNWRLCGTNLWALALQTQHRRSQWRRHGYFRTQWGKVSNNVKVIYTIC